MVALVSGGHSLIVAMEGPGRYRLLGQTLDDAAGEAFDKVARFLGLGYPGGPAIERAAAAGATRPPSTSPGPCWPTASTSPSAGLKTAVVRAVRGPPRRLQRGRRRLVPAGGGGRARDQGGPGGARPSGAGGLCLAGGVAANGPLPGALSSAGGRTSAVPVYLPSRAMCTDNASMIAAAAWWQLEHLGPSPLDTAADPNLRLRLLA